MAVKASNQITIIEHKKIVKIEEWYLVTSYDKDVTIDTNGWSKTIPTMDSTNRYLWNYEETVYSLGKSDVTTPVIIGTYGDVGVSLQIKYISSKDVPSTDDITQWDDAIPEYKDGYNIYMIQKLSNQDTWSTPIQISGSTTTTEIINGYWYINGDSTGVKATGDTPEITIGTDGYWYIDGSRTDSKAQGDTGKDGASIEYVYYLSETEKELTAPYYEDDQLMPSGWSESPQGITTKYKYEYVSVRTKPVGEEWSNFSQPVIWSKWGEKGQDGDGVAYEYYLCNEPDVSKIPAWSESNTDWKDDPQGVSATYKYEYVVQLTIKTSADGTKTTTASSPSLWAKYGETGASLQIKYISSETVPTITDNNVSAWSDTVPSPVNGKKIYMIQKLSTDTNWSAPIQISGTDGEANVSINNDGYWVINGEVTDVQAKGEAPKIEINKDGYWVINDSVTNIKAEGKAGEDGADIEFVYYRGSGTKPSTPYYSDDKLLPDGWKNSPQGVTAKTNEQYEYVSVRHKAAGTNMTWGSFSAPVIWSKWGEKGQDGDGIEYKYCLWNVSNTQPSYPAPNGATYKWEDDPKGVDKDNQYEYVVQIKTTTVDGKTTTTTSAVALWAKYGVDGKGISNIINYYTTTVNADDAPSGWDTNVPELTPTNKYLWNYEHIFYTDESSIITAPAIIGAYGDSGTDAVDFQIYSVDGFQFSQSVTTIELKTVAFSGGKDVSEDATYQWKWWNPTSGTDGAYVSISGATSSNLIVDKTSEYAFSSLKCEMNYNNIIYEDYVTLTMKSAVYTSAVKFFDGSNIFNGNSPYIVAYTELYHNNIIEESIMTNQYYTGISSVTNNGKIETSIEGEFEDGSLMYFICKYNNNKYKAVLGEYYSGEWIVSDYKNKYIYVNDLHQDIISNVFVVSKEDVSKTKEITIQVYQAQYDIYGSAIYNDETLVSRTNVIISDLNDPIISDTPPTSVKAGQLWLNTSVEPYELMIYKPGTKYAPAIGRLVETVTIATFGSSATSANTFYYSDTVDVIDDDKVAKPDYTYAISVAYNNFGTLFSTVKNKYLFVGDNIFYISEDSTFTKNANKVTTGGITITIYTGSARNVHLVTTQIVPSNENGTWEYFTQQSGGAVYTSKPSKYCAGDLWILADNETCGKFGPGTLLKATVTSDVFDESHWTDTMEEMNATITNIKESFVWDDNGIKVMRRVTDSAGNVINPFYVHIDSTRMGFHSVEYDSNNAIKKDVEVVHIGNNSAIIQNATFDGDNGTTFDNSATFNKQINMNGTNLSGASVGFVWKIEPNGSLSLANET